VLRGVPTTPEIPQSQVLTSDTIMKYLLLELMSNQERRMNRKRDETQVIAGTCRRNINAKPRA
jgi:hypothetical protein